MDRPTHQDGIWIDWAWIDARDAATAKRKRDVVAKENLAALRKGVSGAKIGPELSDYLWERTRNRMPDADDKKNAQLLAKQGYGNSFIGSALGLSPERVAEAIT